MNARLEALAIEKRALLDRVALQRLRLRRDGRTLQASLPWNRIRAAASGRPSLARIAAGLAVSVLGLRMGRIGTLAAVVVTALLRRRT